MSDADFELLLAMAEEAEHADITPCNMAQSNPPDDLPAGTAAPPHAPQYATTEDVDEDVNLLLEMAAEAEAAGDPGVIPLSSRRSFGAPEAETSATAAEQPCTKRKAPTSPSAADVIKKARHTETPRGIVLDKTDIGSKAELISSKAPSAAFQPASGRNVRGPPQHSGKPLSGAKALEKHSNLMVKNVEFSLVIFNERVSHLQFVRLPRVRERMNAADSGGPWATVGVLVEKSKPCVSSKGDMYSRWKLSDLDGTTVTVFLFGDAHQNNFRESEGSVVAIVNALAGSSKGKDEATLKVTESTSILKLGTSSDFALCGSRKRDGTKCRNPVNISKCRFCDHHVQTESKRINSTRGVLQDSAHAAKLNTQAEKAAQRQKVQHFGPYIPKQMTEEELAVQSVSYSSQGARHIAALMKAATQENSPQATAAHRPGNAHQTGRQVQESSRELPCYTGSQHRPSRQRPQLQAATSLPRSAGVDPARPARPSLPQHCPGAVRPAPAQRSRTPTDRSAHGTAVQGTSGRPVGTINSAGATRPSSTAATLARPEAGSSVRGSASVQLAAAADSTGAVRPTPMRSAGAAASAGRAAVVPRRSGVPMKPDHSSLQRSSNGNQQSRPPSGRGPAIGAGKEAVQTEQAKAVFVELEEAEIEWDAEDVAAVTRHSRTGVATHRADWHSSPDDGDVETYDGHVWRRPSGVRCPEPASFAAGSSSAAVYRPVAAQKPNNAAEERARHDAMRKAVEHVQRYGGVEKAKEAAKKDQPVAAAKLRHQQAACETTSVQQLAASNGPKSAPSHSGAGPAQKLAERPSASFYGATAAAAQRHGGTAAPGAHPKATTLKAGAHAVIEAKLGLRAKSSVKAKPAAVARAKSLVVPPGTSAFAAAFGDALTEEDMKNVGTRYKETVDEEEADKLDRLLGSMQKKDEVQQRMEAITQLSVGAWHCTICDIITERRKAQCQDHAGKRVNATKRWWTCTGCNNRFTTVGVKYPTKRCPNPRCTAPNSEFKKASMGRPPKAVAGAEGPIAAREHFKPRGTEHAFALNN
ncbi:g7209 [Coccomyxa elongata]